MSAQIIQFPKPVVSDATKYLMLEDFLYRKALELGVDITTDDNGDSSFPEGFIALFYKEGYEFVEDKCQNLD